MKLGSGKEGAPSLEIEIYRRKLVIYRTNN